MIEEMQKCPEKNWEDDQFNTNINIRITSHSILPKLKKNIYMLTAKINRNVQNEGQNKSKTIQLMLKSCVLYLQSIEG